MSGNYFGFTPGGTQFSGAYGAPAAYANTAPAGTYAAAPRAAAPPPPPPVGAAYQVAPTYAQYTYAPAAAPVPQNFQQQNNGTPNRQDQNLGVQQQTATYAYTAMTRTATNATAAGGYYSMPQQQQQHQQHQQQQQQHQQQPQQQTTAATNKTTNVATTAASDMSMYSGYDAAVYAAAKSYLAAKQTTGSGASWMGLRKAGGVTSVGGGGGGGYNSLSAGAASRSGQAARGFPKKYGAGGQNRSAGPVHYCEVCKISCGGAQTYREHLEGQRHKKKAAAQESGTATVNPARTKTSFICEICDVVCTGEDTYNSHVRGSKHQKTLRLHYQLGKPIPSKEPTVLPPANPAFKSIVADAKKVVVVPKLNFVGGEKLVSTGVTATDTSNSQPQTQTEQQETVEEKVTPVGEDYLEVVKIDDGKVTAYHCKLCDCRFTDLGAKEMHMKGRRHRLNFKKKVDPNLEVEVKVHPKMRRFQEDRLRKEIMRARRQDIWSMRAMYQAQLDAQPFGPAFGVPYGYMAPTKPKLDTMLDRYIMTKHAAIYPSDEECQASQKLVVNVERALKAVSDHFAEEAKNCPADGENKVEDERLLKGVMRIKDLAKQLMLRGDSRLDLVVLCSEKPTAGLLSKICEFLENYFKKTVPDSKYDVTSVVSDAAILVKNNQENFFDVNITFTSVAIRTIEDGGDTNKPDPLDVLDKQKCLDALASLRHAKWFQARCTNLQCCLMLLRILKDLRQRVPTWSPLSAWPLELLLEKILNSSSPISTPSEGLRRFFEAISSGILLKNGPGLLDPCEKVTVDALTALSPQQREDLTASAQHCLRLLAFGQVNVVLGMEKLGGGAGGGGGGVGSNFSSTNQQRKRPRDEKDDVHMAQASNGKKDKKDPIKIEPM